MDRWLLITLYGLIFSASLFSLDSRQKIAFAQAVEINSCVNCHQEKTGNERVDRNFFQWKDSWHAAKRVTCDKCHSGKPNETVAANAHAGMLETEGKKTASYYLKMDAKCGQCHTGEYADFSTSSHSKFLQQGSGPSCITFWN